MKNAKPGITGAELDAVVRDYITSRGYGENYVHGLGHGIGLEIHEMPDNQQRGQNVILQPGMTFTVNLVFTPRQGRCTYRRHGCVDRRRRKSADGVKKQLMEIV